MSNVLPFRMKWDSKQMRDTDLSSGSAEIIIFPGVRYEHWARNSGYYDTPVSRKRLCRAVSGTDDVLK